MSSDLPKYDSPPISEAVLSVQFNKIPNFTGAHAGWYWKNYLDSTWLNAYQTSRIGEQFERFGEARIFEPIGGAQQFKISGNDAQRHQFTLEAGDRMVQVQDTRFTYNWIKKDSHYPSYNDLLPEFKEKFKLFENFIEDAKLGTIEQNQWEVTFINEIYANNLMSTLSEISNIIPGFYIPNNAQESLALDTAGFGWTMEIGDQLGRIHISITHGKKGSSEGPELIALQFVARGAIDKSRNIDLSSGFDLGHNTIVNLFTDMTSDDAHKLWERKSIVL